MQAYCDHCGKKTSNNSRPNEITWCHECIKDNVDLLKKQNLELFEAPRIDDVIALKYDQSFGFAINIKKLQTIPKKLQQVSKLPLGTRVKLADNRLGHGQEGVLIACNPGSSYVLGWEHEVDPEVIEGTNLSNLSSYKEVLQDHSCNRYLGLADDRMVEVLPPKPKPGTTVMKLQETKLGDVVRFVGSSYDGVSGTVIATRKDSFALAAKSSALTHPDWFAQLKDSNLTQCESKLTADEIKQFEKFLWFTKDYYDVEIVKSENKKVESEEKMAVNVNTLFAGQEIDHPKHGRMMVLGVYTGSGERLLGKKEAFTGSSGCPGKSASASYSYWDKFDPKDYQAKWFAASEQVNVVGDRVLKFGLKVGDKIEIFKKKSYDGLMDSGYEPDLAAPKSVGTVVGFNSNGEPNVYLDEPGASKDRLNGYNSILIDKPFLDNKSFMDKVNKNPNNFWLIRSDKAFNKVEKKESNMENKETQTFMSMMKGDATSAAYRVAATQMTKGIKSGILAVLEKQGMDGTKMKAIAEMLDTQFGDSLVSILLGLGLTYVPKISEDPRAQRLAGEFRVNGMAVAGNMVMDVAIEHFLPVLTGALNALPQETSTVRVAEVPKAETNLTLEQAIREEEETEKETKTAKV